MRPIRFRAWDKEDEVMCDVDVIGFTEGAVTVSNENVKYYHLAINEVELMQSTGLKDKNGVEIYEGDIVHWMKEFISPMDMRTKHKIDGNRKVYQKESGEWVMGQGNGLHREVENIEVIGNIYENPELLKEQNK